MSADPDPIKILTTDAEVAGWNSEGLPNDQVNSLIFHTLAGETLTISECGGTGTLFKNSPSALPHH